MSHQSPDWRAGLARLGRLIRKELAESLRDRRTLATLLLMPVLLYPLLALAFQQALLYSKVEKAQRVYRIAFASEAEATSLTAYWSLGRKLLQGRHAINASSGGNPFIEPAPQLVVLLATDPIAAVRDGQVDVGVRVTPPGGFRIEPGKQLPQINVELAYRSGSTYGPEAVRYLEVLTGDTNTWVVASRLQSWGERLEAQPCRISAREVTDESGKQASLVPVLVPLILILMTMTGAVYPAIDLTAGERERGTLEILIAAPIPRLSVLLAKYVAVWVVAMLTALVNLVSMTTTLLATGLASVVFGANPSILLVLEVLALLVLFAAFFSAVVLSLTSFARSFKEAQAYLIPLMLVCLTPGMLALLPDLQLNGWLAVVPVINLALLARQVFDGTAPLGGAIAVVVSTLLYSLAGVALAARLFGTEAVLSSDQSGWSDLFRRPTRTRSAADPSAALLCLALMFPTYFILNGILAQLSGLDLFIRLLIAATAQVVLFAGFPLVSAWLGRVEWVAGFRLHAARPWAWLLAGLLGVSLWPFVHELILVQNAIGLSSLSPAVRERIQSVLAGWRQLSPLLVLGVLALAPAVLEELFFRGYLLRALAGNSGSPGKAILGTAILFAVFHLLVTDSLAIERLLPSLLLGLVLGQLAWTSGSVWPGMLLHALHNGIVILLGYYQPQLLEGGWLRDEQTHLPAWLLGSAAVLAAVGLASLWWAERSRTRAISES
jgi:sodium transport system permease protein